MNRFKAGFVFILSSYKRIVAFVFMFAILVAIPITTNFIRQSQDIRQHASTFDNGGQVIPGSYTVYDASGLQMGQAVNKTYDSIQPTPPSLPTFQPDMGWTVFNDVGTPIAQTYLSQSFVTSPLNNQTPGTTSDVLYAYNQTSKNYTPITGTSGSTVGSIQYTKKIVYDASHQKIGQVFIPFLLIQWYQLWLQGTSSSSTCVPKPSTCDNWWAAIFAGTTCQTPTGGWCATTPTPTGTAISATPVPTLTVSSTSCTPYPPNCVINGQNVCQFLKAPTNGWCPITSVTPFPTPSGVVCAEVITYGKNISTGQVQQFPTACLPTGWIPISNPTVSPPPIACPQIARLCPDGSSVSATGPNCTFPACPGVSPTPAPTTSLTSTPTPGPLCGYTCPFGYSLNGSSGGALGDPVNNFCQPWIGSQTIPATSTCHNPNPTGVAQCTLHSKGDANCDGKVNTDDFNMWRDSFLNLQASLNYPFNADFNNDHVVNTDDFNVWRDAFLGSNSTINTSVTPNPNSNKLSSVLLSLYNGASIDSYVTSGSGALQFENGKIKVTIRTSDTSPTTQNMLTSHGVTVYGMSPQYRVFDGAIAIPNLQEVANLSNVEYVEEAISPINN